MKGIILAAGQGLRLKPLTDDRPKCMVAYKNRPIINYALAAMTSAAIDPIVLVGGYRQETLKKHLCDFPVIHVRNPEYATTNMVHSLFCAESELDGDMIISYGDIIYGPEILNLLIRSTDNFAITIDKNWKALWSSRMEDPLDDVETLKLDENNFVLDLGRKPKNESEVQGQYMGLIKIAGSLWPDIKKIHHQLGPEKKTMYMTDFIRKLIDEKMQLKAIPIATPWLEIDAETDLNVEIHLDEHHKR